MRIFTLRTLKKISCLLLLCCAEISSLVCPERMKSWSCVNPALTLALVVCGFVWLVLIGNWWEPCREKCLVFVSNNVYRETVLLRSLSEKKVQVVNTQSFKVVKWIMWITLYPTLWFNTHDDLFFFFLGIHGSKSEMLLFFLYLLLEMQHVHVLAIRVQQFLLWCACCGWLSRGTWKEFWHVCTDCFV